MTDVEPERQQPERCTVGCVHGWHGQRCDWRPKIPGLPPVPPCDCPGAWGATA